MPPVRSMTPTEICCDSQVIGRSTEPNKARRDAQHMRPASTCSTAGCYSSRLGLLPGSPCPMGTRNGALHASPMPGAKYLTYLRPKSEIAILAPGISVQSPVLTAVCNVLHARHLPLSFERFIDLKPVLLKSSEGTSS